MKRILCATFFCLSALATTATEIARGYVYLDANGNGRRDRSEAGVASVGVSNGDTIVSTDARGYYELPVDTNQVIFVIKPAGYRFPEDANHLPRYYYVHRPQGSPAHYKFKGVAPTGPLPRQLDFALLASEESDQFTALVFGDPQVRNPTMLGFYEQKIITELVDAPEIAFGISLGDVSDEDLDLMGPIAEITGRIGTTWHYVNGNHDTNYDADEDKMSNETFIRYYGPVDYSFNYGKAHFLVIDDICFPDPGNPTERRWAARTGLRADQRRFIENDLARVSNDQLVVLAMHIPLCDPENLAGDVTSYLMGQLSRFDHVLVLSAHHHLLFHNFYTEADGWQGSRPLHEFVVGATCGSWYSGFADERGIPESMLRDGTPQGYNYLRVDGNRYQLVYKAAERPADYQMEITCPRVVLQDRHTPSMITVNFFMGHSDDTVEFRVGDGPWRPMKHKVMLDPTYQRMKFRWDDMEAVRSTRWPEEPWPSTHIWQAPVPSRGIGLGEHTIEVRATDRWGHTHYGSTTYRVAEAPNSSYP